VMSVEPGFYGQPFMPESINRIKRLKNKIETEKFNVMIQVDGGINTSNIKDVVSAGAEIIVAGSSAYRDMKINENTAALKKAAIL